MRQTRKSKTNSLVMTAMFAAILCISAYLSITLPTGSHISLINLTVLFIGISLPPFQAAAAILIWMLLGIVGIPVFAGGMAGPGYLFGSLGGFSISFFFVSWLLSFFCKLITRHRRIFYYLLTISAVIFIDLFGTVWYMLSAETSLRAAMAVCFLPFIPLDIVKALVAAHIAPQLRKIAETV